MTSVMIPGTCIWHPYPSTLEDRMLVGAARPILTKEHTAATPRATSSPSKVARPTEGGGTVIWVGAGWQG
jgi:hypothetical protein